MVAITRRLLTTSLAASSVALMGRGAAAADTVRFTLLLVNDIYRMGEEKGRGGFARLAAVVKAERERARAEGRGVIVLIRESRPDAISSRLRSEEKPEQSGQQRLIEYGIGAQILLDLGVHEMVLLSNSPARKIVGLEGYGLKVVGHRSLAS